MELEFCAEFKNRRKKKVCNRNSNHYISPGKRDLRIFTKYQPKGRGFDPRTYVVIWTSIKDLLFSPIFKFGTKFYILWATLYAQPQIFIWGLKYPNRVMLKYPCQMENSYRIEW